MQLFEIFLVTEIFDKREHFFDERSDLLNEERLCYLEHRWGEQISIDLSNTWITFVWLFSYNFW